MAALGASSVGKLSVATSAAATSAVATSAVAAFSIAAGLPLSAGAQSFHYTDSSTVEKLQSRVGFEVEQDALSLDADLTLIGQGGDTDVLPKLTFGSSLVDGLDVETVLAYGDFNEAATAYSPTIDTKLELDAGGVLVDKIEGSLRRTSTGADEKLSVRFSELDTGWQLFGGDALGIRGDLALSEAGDDRAAVSTVRSSFGLGAAVDIESTVRVEADEASGAGSPGLDTRIVYTVPLAFVDRIEGAVARKPSGDERAAVSVLFPDFASGDPAASFKLQAQATLEELAAPGAADELRMGLTTKLTGFATPLLGGTNSLMLKLERGLAADAWTQSSLAYDHTWAPAERSSVGLNLEVARKPDDLLEPTLGIKWLKQF
jgi:hypothetical protein